MVADIVKRRWEQLSVVADRPNASYGRAVVNLGAWVEPPGYAGVKIAFNRVPDLKIFEPSPACGEGRLAERAG